MARRRLERVLDGVAGLLVGPRRLQDVCGKHIADAVRAVRQEAGDSAAPGPGIVNPVALDQESPGLLEGGLVVEGVPLCCRPPPGEPLGGGSTETDLIDCSLVESIVGPSRHR